MAHLCGTSIYLPYKMNKTTSLKSRFDSIRHQNSSQFFMKTSFQDIADDQALDRQAPTNNPRIIGNPCFKDQEVVGEEGEGEACQGNPTQCHIITEVLGIAA